MDGRTERLLCANSQGQMPRTNQEIASWASCLCFHSLRGPNLDTHRPSVRPSLLTRLSRNTNYFFFLCQKIQFKKKKKNHFPLLLNYLYKLRIIKIHWKVSKIDFLFTNRKDFKTREQFLYTFVRIIFFFIIILYDNLIIKKSNGVNNSKSEFRFQSKIKKNSQNRNVIGCDSIGSHPWVSDLNLKKHRIYITYMLKNNNYINFIFYKI